MARLDALVAAGCGASWAGDVSGLRRQASDRLHSTAAAMSGLRDDSKKALGMVKVRRAARARHRRATSASHRRTRAALRRTGTAPWARTAIPAG